MTMTLPEENQNYGNKSYWIDRFQREDVYEWLVGYQQIKNILRKYIDKNDTILILGKYLFYST